MTRRNVVIDDDLLNAAMEATGERTYSATIARGLEGLVRQVKMRRALDSIAGIGWDGDLDEMRGRPPRSTPQPVRFKTPEELWADRPEYLALLREEQASWQRAESKKVAAQVKRAPAKPKAKRRTKRRATR